MPPLTSLRLCLIAGLAAQAWSTSACGADPTLGGQSRSGDAFLAEVLSSLERLSNVSAQLRYQSHFDKETQVGSGKYWQQGVGLQRLSRWEMQTQIADEPASFVQVFDGRYVWTDKHLPSGRQVRRLDVANLKSRLRVSHRIQTTATEWDELLQSTELRGGISQLLAELLRRYEFAPPYATQLNGFEVEALLGEWRHEQLLQLSPTANAAAPAASTWPEQLPHHVLLLVGQSNLFPYVIEFRRVEDAYLTETLAGMKPAQDPLLRYEIFSVHFADAIDASIFQFKPGDVEWTDETSLVFERISTQQNAASEVIANRRK